MVYLLGWALSYFSLLLWYAGVRSRIFFVFTFCYLAALIVIRYSGTDTYPIYERILRDMLEGIPNELIQGLEPGFVLLSKSLLWLTNSEVWAVRGIGVIFIMILLVYLFRADRTEILFLFLYFVPVLVYQYGMNAVRAGLGLALMLLAWQMLRRNHWWSFAFLALLSLLLHYSLVLVLALFLFFETKIRDWRTVAIIGISVAALIMLILLNREYFESKLSLYSDYNSPSELSGLSRFVLIGLLWVFFALSSRFFWPKIRTFIGLVAPAVGFQMLASISYAGTRFLELLTFVTPLILIRELEKTGKIPGRVFWLGLTVVGLLGAAFLYRNFLSDFDGQMTGTPTPFLPYRTIFDYQP